MTVCPKVARSGDDIIGIMEYKRGVGFTRQTLAYNRLAMESDITFEYVRFPLFVDDEIDFVQISTSVGFTADGITAIGGHGIVGRFEEEYVTLAILTNARLTQASLEILALGNPRVDLTQCCFEMLWIPNSNGLCTQVVEEILYLANVAVVNGDAIEALAAGTGGNLYDNFVGVEVLGSIHANTLMSQATKEVLATGDPYARVSQVTEEVIVYSQLISYSNVDLQAVVIETIMAPAGNLDVQSVTLEIIENSRGDLDVNAVAIEIVHNDLANLDVNAVSLEEINNTATRNLCVEGVSVECLVLFETDYTVASLVNNPRYCI